MIEPLWLGKKSKARKNIMKSEAYSE